MTLTKTETSTIQGRTIARGTFLTSGGREFGLTVQRIGGRGGEYYVRGAFTGCKGPRRKFITLRDAQAFCDDVLANLETV